MPEFIHGHEVLEMMVNSKDAFTKESLEQAINEKFGVDARFHTCSASHMTAKELIDFLQSRGKFIPPKKHHAWMNGVLGGIPPRLDCEVY